MKLVALSDTHGQHEIIQIPKADILCICGDIVPLKMQSNIPQSLSWFKKRFIPWLQSLGIDQIYLIGGNHDFFLEKEEKQVKESLLGTNITYLNNNKAEYLDNDGVLWSIYGSPLCHRFGNWAFMYDEEYLGEKFSLIPKNLDILLTHDAPYNRNDQCFEGWNPTEHIGNLPLLKAVEEKKPKYHFTGHLHTSDHNLVDYDGTKTACVSVLNERYGVAYTPLVLELHKNLEESDV